MLYSVKAVGQNSHSYPTEGHRRIHNQPSHLNSSTEGKVCPAKRLILVALGFYLIGVLVMCYLLILTESRDRYQ